MMGTEEEPPAKPYQVHLPTDPPESQSTPVIPLDSRLSLTGPRSSGSVTRSPVLKSSGVKVYSDQESKSLDDSAHSCRRGDASSAWVAPVSKRRPNSFSHHRSIAPSAGGEPRQTTLKALALRRQASGGQKLTIAAGASSPLAAPDVDRDRPQTAILRSRPSRLSGLEIQGEGLFKEKSPLTARPLVIQSPCFVHWRFDDAVDLDKVLEEIADDQWMSHSRLMQTAIGVREVSKQLRRRPIRRAVRNVMIVTKARDNELVILTRELAEWLIKTPRYGSDRGVNVFVDTKLRHSRRFDAAGLLQQDAHFEDMLHYWDPHICGNSSDQFDLVVTLGGDGTVLFTSWLFQRIVPPVLSFSLGSLGFLTNFTFDRYREHLDRVMGDAGMRVNLRMRFTCTVYRSRAVKGGATKEGAVKGAAVKGDCGFEVEECEQFEVLNEVVIDRGPSPYVSNLEVYGDDELLTVVQADGCIFSTPTGGSPHCHRCILIIEKRHHQRCPAVVVSCHYHDAILVPKSFLSRYSSPSSTIPSLVSLIHSQLLPARAHLTL